jgi:prophage DNA circulation protein
MSWAYLQLCQFANSNQVMPNLIRDNAELQDKNNELVERYQKLVAELTELKITLTPPQSSERQKGYSEMNKDDVKSFIENIKQKNQGKIEMMKSEFNAEIQKNQNEIQILKEKISQLEQQNDNLLNTKKKLIKEKKVLES